MGHAVRVKAISVQELRRCIASPLDSAYSNDRICWDNMANETLHPYGGIGSRAPSEGFHGRTTNLTTTLHIAGHAHQSPASAGTCMFTAINVQV